MLSALPEEALQERLNDIYWNSDTTIAEIVRTTGVTRNRLYLAVRPLEMDGSCGECAGALQFPNRRARLARLAVCSACGQESSPVAVMTQRSSSPAAGGSPEHLEALPGEEAERPERDRPRGERVALMGGAAALGVVLAAAATRVLK